MKCKRNRFLADPNVPTWIYPIGESESVSGACELVLDEESCKSQCQEQSDCNAFTWRGEHITGGDTCCYLSDHTHHEAGFTLGRGTDHNEQDYVYCYKEDDSRDSNGFFNHNATGGVGGVKKDRSGMCIPEGGSLHPRMYIGTNSVTKNGEKCKAWTWEYSVQTANQFPEETLEEASNYCRDPSSSGGVWCYTGVNFAGVRQWDWCDIPTCNQLWRFDLRCGAEFPAANGQPSECSASHPEGYSCCSNNGWCGNTAEHCDCEDCVDYTDSNECDNRPCGYGICKDEEAGYSCDCTGSGAVGSHCGIALFRMDLRCGAEFGNSHGWSAQCDPNHPKGYACCSPDGYCGNTEEHCTCETCTDYRGK